MARLARLVVPGIPHHVTQRGNRRQRTFFTNDDYGAYKSLMARCCTKSGVTILAYCLMPNHVHLIAVPSHATSLRRAIGDAHLRYTRRINFREGWRGHLWQGRFTSFPMDAAHLHACARYIECNPVRAHMVPRAEDWPHSSARAHLRGQADALVSVQPLLGMIGDWRAFLEVAATDSMRSAFGYHERTGRPMGSDAFIDQLEVQTQRSLRKRPPGRKPKPRTTSPCRNMCGVPGKSSLYRRRRCF